MRSVLQVHNDKRPYRRGGDQDSQSCSGLPEALLLLSTATLCMLILISQAIRTAAPVSTGPMASENAQLEPTTTALALQYAAQ